MSFRRQRVPLGHHQGSEAEVVTRELRQAAELLNRFPPIDLVSMKQNIYSERPS